MEQDTKQQPQAPGSSPSLLLPAGPSICSSTLGAHAHGPDPQPQSVHSSRSCTRQCKLIQVLPPHKLEQGCNMGCNKSFMLSCLVVENEVSIDLVGMLGANSSKKTKPVLRVHEFVIIIFLITVINIIIILASGNTVPEAASAAQQNKCHSDQTAPCAAKHTQAVSCKWHPTAAVKPVPVAVKQCQICHGDMACRGHPQWRLGCPVSTHRIAPLQLTPSQAYQRPPLQVRCPRCNIKTSSSRLPCRTACKWCRWDAQT